MIARSDTQGCEYQRDPDPTPRKWIISILGLSCLACLIVGGMLR